MKSELRRITSNLFNQTDIEKRLVSYHACGVCVANKVLSLIPGDSIEDRVKQSVAVEDIFFSLNNLAVIDKETFLSVVNKYVKFYKTITKFENNIENIKNGQFNNMDIIPTIFNIKEYFNSDSELLNKYSSFYQEVINVITNEGFDLFDNITNIIGKD